MATRLPLRGQHEPRIPWGSRDFERRGLLPSNLTDKRNATTPIGSATEDQRLPGNLQALASLHVLSDAASA